MAGEIRDLVESNRRMLMGASHDLRSPISRIRVALSLASTAPELERNELLGRIEIELLRLNEMIEQILTVARLESGQLRLRGGGALAESGHRRGGGRRPLRGQPVQR